MKTSTILGKARELIRLKSKWCDGVEARDKNGDEVDPWDKTAVKFCANGAVLKVVGEKKNETTEDADIAKNYLDVAAIAEGYEDIFDYNDNNGGHKGVQKLFTKAIKSAKQDEKEGAK